MAKVLIVTVGGSHQPILTAVRDHEPAFTYFLCSRDSRGMVEGTGKVIKSDGKLDKADLPNIAAQLGLAEGDHQVDDVEGHDDFGACYLKSAELIRRARAERPGATLVADYTGGTKSMSAGLAAAALNDGGCATSVVVGRRDDLRSVVNTTEYVRRLSLDAPQVLLRMAAAADHLKRYDYAAANRVLRDASARLTGGEAAGLERGITLCSAFDQWDRFDHAGAHARLGAHQGELLSHWRVIKALAGEGNAHGFEAVEDLLLNAERRHAQGRFDDAVGRVYRAVEMTAQAWLEGKYGIKTGDVALDKVPEPARVRLAGRPTDNGKIKIGLAEAWGLIADFPDDPLGALYGPRRDKLKGFLEVRNQSLLAHGVRPVTAADYEKHVPVVRGWLLDAVAAAVPALGRKRPVVLEQMPTDFLTAPA